MALTIAAGEQSDADVLRKVRRGDRIAYGLLYSRHVGAARRLARGILGRRPEADDVVAEVFASTLAALDGGRGPVDAFAPYLLSSVRYECYRVLRRDVTGEPVEHDALDRLATAPASRPAGRDAFARVDEDEVLQQAFATLSSRQRAVLWHTEVDGLSHESIAAMTGSTPRAVSSLALRARQALGDAYLQAHVVIPARGASD
nr:sigma-70 family RNA polymerase sigma factor [Acidimicrobiia bacterium]